MAGQKITHRASGAGAAHPAADLVAGGSRPAGRCAAHAAGPGDGPPARAGGPAEPALDPGLPWMKTAACRSLAGPASCTTVRGALLARIARGCGPGGHRVAS